MGSSTLSLKIDTIRKGLAPRSATNIEKGLEETLKPLCFWLRGQDLNLGPLGYEPNELPDCSTPRSEILIQDGLSSVKCFFPKSYFGIPSPMAPPISPPVTGFRDAAFEQNSGPPRTRS